MDSFISFRIFYELLMNSEMFISTLERWYVFLMNVEFDYSVLSLISTVLAGFISIGIPIGLNVVTKHTEEYKDKEISESFLKTWLYRVQIYVVPILIFLALIAFSLKLKNGWPVYLILILDIVGFILFVCFLRLLGKYATNFDTIYSNRLKRESDEIVENK